MGWPAPLVSLAVTNLTPNRLGLAVEDYLDTCKAWNASTQAGEVLSGLSKKVSWKRYLAVLDGSDGDPWKLWDPPPTEDDILDDRDNGIGTITVWASVRRQLTASFWGEYQVLSYTERRILGEFRIFESISSPTKIQLHAATLPPAENLMRGIAEYLIGRYPDRIRALTEKRMLPPADFDERLRAVAKDRDRDIIRLWGSGLSGSTIADRLGVSASTINNRISELRKLYGAALVPYHRDTSEIDTKSG